jgi:hypothetical protein
MQTAPQLADVSNRIVGLVLSFYDRSREQVLGKVARASPSFREFFLILRDPSVGIRREAGRSSLVNYAWIYAPVIILIFIVYVILGIHLDFETAGICSFVTAITAIIVIVWLSRFRIPEEVKSSQGKLIGSEKGNKVLITLLHLKLASRYALLVSVGFIGAALKTFLLMPGSLFKGIVLLQNEIVASVVVAFIIVVLIAPFWLLRLYQIEFVRRTEDLLFQNHFGSSYPQIEATVNRRLGVEKVYGRITSIGKFIEISKPANYVESFEWRDVVGMATVRDK